MANSSTGGPQKRNSVKAPLIFSAVLALIAGVATMIFATGGAEQELRFDLGLIAVGIAFIASLLVSSLLLMTEKPNPEHLSQGSGIHRSSAKIPGGAGHVGRPASSAPDTTDTADDSPRPTDPTA
ncbi:hypothetical protein [Arthrobacter zhaoxinii]|uniref:hypothetical protein n=1 Tax=Arthrobacter zhaoxinii TaxID=2964616 RepID=UPI002103941F|nr:hypothetical protein [Arthrobacter zhaoxinii]MCQ2000110.1 hypothetical protein [Arthrobacter zhaoxinii]